MKKPRKKAVKSSGKTGPKPEILAIDGDWKDAVGFALTSGKPPIDSMKTPKKKKIK